MLAGADDNRLQNYKIGKFIVFVRIGGEGGGAGGSGVLNVSFERLRRGGGYQNWTSANKGRGVPSFGHFVIT